MDESFSTISIDLKTNMSQNKHTIAEKLLDLGADPNQILEGDSLLIHAIKSKSESSALFLLNNKARVIYGCYVICMTHCYVI